MTIEFTYEDDDFDPALRPLLRRNSAKLDRSMLRMCAAGWLMLNAGLVHGAIFVSAVFGVLSVPALIVTALFYRSWWKLSLIDAIKRMHMNGKPVSVELTPDEFCFFETGKRTYVRRETLGVFDFPNQWVFQLRNGAVFIVPKRAIPDSDGADWRREMKRFQTAP